MNPEQILRLLHIDLRPRWRKDELNLAEAVVAAQVLFRAGWSVKQVSAALRAASSGGAVILEVTGWTDRYESFPVRYTSQKLAAAIEQDTVEAYLLDCLEEAIQSGWRPGAETYHAVLVAVRSDERLLVAHAALDVGEEA